MYSKRAEHEQHTRIVELKLIGKAGAQATLAYHDTNSIKNQIKFEHYSGRIEVTHFEESNSCEGPANWSSPRACNWGSSADTEVR
jgi:hypothetical protein